MKCQVGSAGIHSAMEGIEPNWVCKSYIYWIILESCSQIQKILKSLATAEMFNEWLQHKKMCIAMYKIIKCNMHCQIIDKS